MEGGVPNCSPPIGTRDTEDSPLVAAAPLGRSKPWGLGPPLGSEEVALVPWDTAVATVSSLLSLCRCKTGCVPSAVEPCCSDNVFSLGTKTVGWVVEV